MKKKLIRFFKRSLLIIVIGIVIIKIGFEIDNYYYESKLNKMEKENKLNVNIESLIENKTLELDDCVIHYYISGIQNEKSIVFLHPAFSDHTAFDQQIDYFSTDYKVITIDLIGHGISKANKSTDKIDASSEHILKILELEKIDQTHLVGVSMGSLIAQYFALNYPTKTLSLTSLGGYNINTIDDRVQKAQRGINLNLIFRAIFSMKAFRKKASSITCESERGKALFYATTRLYERKSFMVMQGLQKIVKNRKNVEPNYPTLLMTGEFELELARQMNESWHSTSNNSEYYVIKNAGHCANIDEPLLFNEKLKAFIDKNNSSQ